MNEISVDMPERQRHKDIVIETSATAAQELGLPSVRWS